MFFGRRPACQKDNLPAAYRRTGLTRALVLKFFSEVKPDCRKGTMLSLQGDLDGAEQNYLASLDVARQQQAKSWELRAATNPARLWQQQGKIAEARQMLSEIYNWFTEG